MEALYKKLYNKYKKLKKGKDTEMENLNRDQEVKFVNFVDASDELIGYLRTENDRLNKQVSELRNVMALNRSSKDEECENYQRLLMEENQKNKQLSEEIERLHNLQREGLCCRDNGDKADHIPLDTPGSSSNDISVKMMRKRKRLSLRGSGNSPTPCAAVDVGPAELFNSPHKPCKCTMDGDVLPSCFLPECCRRKINSPGDDTAETSIASCIFQDLVEFALGMKISTITQSEEFGVSVYHPSSGYSFSLTWINNPSSEPELLYRVLSLGTFERVAPEWMRDILMFSTSMVPIFFDRVSRVIKHNH